MTELSLTERVMKSEDFNEFEKLLGEGRELLMNDSNYIVLPSNNPIVFVGDLHGDYETLKQIIEKYSKNNTLVFLGDYVDRTETHFGSMDTFLYLIEQKIKNPESVFLLRGNHEFKHINMENGFLDEIKNYILYTREMTGLGLFDLFNNTFNALPYIVTTENGIISLHGGIPNITEANEIKELSKEVEDIMAVNDGIESRKKHIISQIVWNDNLLTLGDKFETKTDLMRRFESIQNSRFNEEGYTYNSRIGSHESSEEYGILYGENYFDKKMDLLDKKILVRGHDHKAKGYTLNNKVLTVVSSELYYAAGNIRGVYVAVLDPQKNIKDARDLKIEQIN